jgi:putative ABC transport system permease protein
MMSALDGEVVADFNTGVTETNNSAVLTSLAHLQKLYETPNVTFWSVWLKDPRRLGADLKELKRRLKDAGLIADLYPWMDEAVAPFYTGTMQFLYTMVTFITVVLATVIIFSIFNAATITVIERSAEIGMMRALGFTRRHIRQLFVMEMLALATVSIIAGGAIGAAGIYAVNHADIHFNPPGVAGGMILLLEPNAAIIGAAAGLIFALAVITTLIAVRNVAKRKIAVLIMGTQR